MSYGIVQLQWVFGGSSYLPARYERSSSDDFPAMVRERDDEGAVEGWTKLNVDTVQSGVFHLVWQWAELLEIPLALGLSVLGRRLGYVL
ncbi:hypothetical protein GOBAR_DD08542 [Gossypium barbadense]|nr:hypothetical protein GOBAR_DD08542 [Gossypium barbadense]